MPSHSTSEYLRSGRLWSGPGPAAAGANAGVLIWMSEKGKMDPVPSPLKGQATLSEAEVADLTAGNLYINIHTAAHKDGEIRGQVILPQ